MTHTIRANQLVEDPRLNRLVYFDPRSRNFPITSVVKTKPLRSYTWRCSQWFDQGAQGSCVAFSLGHELAARPAEVKGITPAFLVRKVYWGAQLIDPWDGGSYPGASPSYEGTSILAGVKVLHSMGFFTSYYWSFSTTDLLLGVGYNGPAVIGIPWYSSMMEPDKNGMIKPTGILTGGHAVLVTGVDLKNTRVRIRNSWGKAWGKNGDCFLSFEDLDTLLQRNGEAVFLQKRTASVPPGVLS